jgi:FlaA1/EpsC-like NDP-sugar epimerase
MTSQRSVNRILLNIALDGALAAVAAPLASWIARPQDGVLRPLWFLAGGAITLLVAGVPFRLSQQYWRFASMADMLGVVGGSVVSAALFSLLLVAAGFPLPTPTFPIVHALVLMAALGAPRIAYRLRHARRPGPASTLEARPVLLVGAGEGADLFLRALEYGRGAYRVLGILSLGDAQTGRRIHGQTILGTVRDAAAVLARLRDEERLPSALVVTEPDLAGPQLAGLLAAADAAGVPVRRVPRPFALQSAARGAEALELAPIAIEDLLNRPEAPLDRDGMARLVQGRRVLVTGAGGTIGSELARQVAALGPASLLLLDNGEYALWQVDLELGETYPAVPRRAVIADIRDEPRIRGIFERFRPELVFHAAALKHVPMVEANPAEGLLTNAAGTRHVADAARSAGAQAMVLISTDKAVNPTSIMGASKRLAEMYCQGLDVAARRSGGQGQTMRCVTVRFGNVLGSTGSVVPLFRRQLERGGPLTVTHPDMQRYFMTVREAVGLVLEATVLGISEDRSGEGSAEGGIFVLDMGDPVKIVDLARQMIRLAGLRPDEDVAIRFTGLRPGEKLSEELFHGKEPLAATANPGLLTAAPRTADPAIVGRAIEEIASACRAGQDRLALATLGRLVPEFDHAAEPSRAALPGA